MVGRYAVNINSIDEVAVPSIMPRDPDSLIVIDEVGKMECCSPKFRKAVVEALDAPNLILGTIPKGGTPFIRSLKNRDDLKVIEVTRKNRNNMVEIILEELLTMAHNR